jgi:hypothetical protein
MGTLEVWTALALPSRRDNDDGKRIMQGETKYRKYAEECERIARESKPEHRAALLAIARAWRMCAETAEQKERQTREASWERLLTP